jgi:hypothetical protein
MVGVTSPNALTYGWQIPSRVLAIASTPEMTNENFWFTGKPKTNSLICLNSRKALRGLFHQALDLTLTDRHSL